MMSISYLVFCHVHFRLCIPFGCTHTRTHTRTHAHARTHERTHARTHTHTHTHTDTCPRHKNECPYANRNMRTHTPNTNNTSLPIPSLRNTSSTPAFVSTCYSRHTCRDSSHMLSAHAQRLLFGLAWFVKECFLHEDYLHGGLQQDMLYTTKPLQK